ARRRFASVSRRSGSDVSRAAAVAKVHGGDIARVAAAGAASRIAEPHGATSKTAWSTTKRPRATPSTSGSAPLAEIHARAPTATATRTGTSIQAPLQSHSLVGIQPDS